jgi:hypothetical protein
MNQISQYTTRFGRRIRPSPSSRALNPIHDESTSSDDSDYVPPSDTDTSSDDSLSTISLVSEHSVDSAGTPQPSVGAIPRQELFETPSLTSISDSLEDEGEDGEVNSRWND